MLPQLLGRALLAAGKAVATMAVSRAAEELRRPETQQKLAQASHAVAARLRDPETPKEIERIAGTVRDSSARALGRAFGNLRNR